MFSTFEKAIHRLFRSTQRLIAICRGIAVRSGLEKKLKGEPIILGGCPRSGTTLLLSILSAHPDIFAIPRETGVFRYNEKNAKLLLNIKFNLNYFYGAFFRKVPKSAKRWCEKTPGNVLYLKELLEIFNNKIKIIHIVRDGRDVILSKHPTNKEKYWVEPEVWVDYVSKGLKFFDHPNVLTIKYEDLILHYQETILKVCSFLNLPSSEQILNWYENTRVKENSAWNEGRVAPISSKSIEKWKKEKYKERVNMLTENPSALDLLRRFEYVND